MAVSSAEPVKGVCLRCWRSIPPHFVKCNMAPTRTDIFLARILVGALYFGLVCVIVT